MIAAWQAAEQLYPQRVALDDPLLMGMIAPESDAGSDVTETAYAFQLNQKLPSFGKRSLRGLWQPPMQMRRFMTPKIRRGCRCDWPRTWRSSSIFLVTQQLRNQRRETRSMLESRDTAQSRYRTNLVTQQDILQAELSWPTWLVGS